MNKLRMTRMMMINLRNHIIRRKVRERGELATSHLPEDLPLKIKRNHIKLAYLGLFRNAHGSITPNQTS